MGYRVDYQPLRKVRGIEKCRSRLLSLTALCFLLFCVLVSQFRPQTADMIWELLVPGDAAVTTAALDVLAEELKSGESFEEALKDFCLRIREGRPA